MRAAAESSATAKRSRTHRRERCEPRGCHRAGCRQRANECRITPEPNDKGEHGGHANGHERIGDQSSWTKHLMTVALIVGAGPPDWSWPPRRVGGVAYDPMTEPGPDDVHLRDVENGDLEGFFVDQCDSDATQMAAFPARERDPFMAHWARILADASVVARTIVADGRAAGHVVSWEQSSRRAVGYWISRGYWGRGIATKALMLFLCQVPVRPLYAHVAVHNVASIRVLKKCGFRTAEPAEVTAPAVDDGVEEVVLILAS